MSFYEIEQNNSHGEFRTVAPLAPVVIVEADSEGDAIKRLEQLGCYWNGIENKDDCKCCGDRWEKKVSLVETVVNDDTILPTVEAVAHHKVDLHGADASIVFKDDTLKIFIVDKDDYRLTNLQICNAEKKDIEEVSELPADQRPATTVPKGTVPAHTLEDDQGGELLCTNGLLNGQPIFKKEGEVFLFHDGGFKKVNKTSLKFWGNVGVKIDT